MTKICSRKDCREEYSDNLNGCPRCAIKAELVRFKMKRNSDRTQNKWKKR